MQTQSREQLGSTDPGRVDRNRQGVEDAFHTLPCGAGSKREDCHRIDCTGAGNLVTATGFGCWGQLWDVTLYLSPIPIPLGVRHRTNSSTLMLDIPKAFVLLSLLET